MEEIDRSGFTSYSCRHTYISNVIKSGMDLPDLEAIVGHVDRETTRIYTHLRASNLVDAVQNLHPTSLTVCNKSVTSHEEATTGTPKKLAK